MEQGIQSKLCRNNIPKLSIQTKETAHKKRKANKIQNYALELRKQMFKAWFQKTQNF